ncbi:MAG: hypothetical protein ABII23_06840, partial [bacterium]
YQKIEFQQILIKKDASSLLDKDMLIMGLVYVNNEYHQPMMNFLPKVLRVLQSPERRKLLSKVISYYRSFGLPYQYISPKKVLIIASGVGNEAAKAIENGAEEIVAVEIDPEIIEIGKKYHPQNPYRHKNVTVYNDDARAYLQRSTKKYDLIVMNQLDSHSQYASTANLRLDSYLYTIESFQQIRDHLKENGIFTMIFSGYHWSIAWSRERLIAMIEAVFGPNSWEASRVLGGQFLKILPQKVTSGNILSSVILATDDWPQFYMKERKIPLVYWRLAVLILLLSLVIASISVPKLITQLQYHFFFLGAGFMMLEVKNISQASLLFGNTWVVNSIVLSAILTAILCANFYVIKIKSNHMLLHYLLLFISIAVTYLIPYEILLKLQFEGKLLASLLIIGLPIFFAGIIFAHSFKSTGNVSISLGSNLIGCMAGGMGEYAALVLGIKNLSFIVILFYVLSALPILKYKINKAVS